MGFGRSWDKDGSRGLISGATARWGWGHRVPFAADPAGGKTVELADRGCRRWWWSAGWGGAWVVQLSPTDDPPLHQATTPTTGVLGLAFGLYNG